MTNTSPQLIRLCKKGDLEKVKNFIADNPGIDIHADNETAFIAAACEDSLEVVKYFVEEYKVDIHSCDDTAFIMSVFHRRSDMMKYLLEECNADIHAQDEGALSISVTNGYLEVAKYLIKNGADHSVFKDNDKKTYDFCENIIQEFAKERAVERSLRIQKAEDKFKDNVEILKKEATKKRPARRNVKTAPKPKDENM